MLVVMCVTPFFRCAQETPGDACCGFYDCDHDRASALAHGVCHRPEAFLFGNPVSASSLEDLTTSACAKRALMRKLRFFKEVLRPSWPLSRLPHGRHQAGLALRNVKREHFLRIAPRNPAFPFLLLAPSRYHYQHFFALVPFLTLGVVLGLTRGCEEGQPRTRLLIVLVLSTVALAAGGEAYREVWSVGKTDEWFSLRARKFGEEIRGFVPTGKVLTLAPTFPWQPAFHPC